MHSHIRFPCRAYLHLAASPVLASWAGRIAVFIPGAWHKILSQLLDEFLQSLSAPLASLQHLGPCLVPLPLSCLQRALVMQVGLAASSGSIIIVQIVTNICWVSQRAWCRGGKIILPLPFEVLD